MAGTTTKPKPVVTIPANLKPDTVAARISGVVDRTSVLSDDLLDSLETSERAAIEALGAFVVTVEEALPQEVADTAAVAKKITVSGLEMTDRLVHTQYALLRKGIESTGKALRAHGEAKLPVAH
jgi:hypothetical protein